MRPPVVFMFSGQGSHYSILPEVASFPDQGTTFTVTFPHTIPEYSCVWNVVTRKILPLLRRMKKNRPVCPSGVSEYVMSVLEKSGEFSVEPAVAPLDRVSESHYA